MKNQKGITLVALVVTIVVLLILAGTAIAMLQGDNGIITNAQKAQAANKEGEVRENINSAFNTVKTEVSVQRAVKPDYDADSESTAISLNKIILEELGFTVTATDTTLTVDTSPAGYEATLASDFLTLTITYSDSTFDSTNGKYKDIVATYKITADNNITLEYDTNNKTMQVIK